MKSACMPRASRKTSNTALFVVAMNEILLIASYLLWYGAVKKEQLFRYTNQT